MADPHVVSQLRAKQAELQSGIAYLETKLAEARANLLHVNATLLLFELPDDAAPDPGQVNLRRVFPRGELVALTIAILRDAGAPMTSLALAGEIIRCKGWDVDDPVLRRSITTRLKLPLRRAGRMGKLVDCGCANRARVWALPTLTKSP